MGSIKKRDEKESHSRWTRTAALKTVPLSKAVFYYICSFLLLASSARYVFRHKCKYLLGLVMYP